MRQDTRLESGDKNNRKFQTLGRVQGHQRHGVGVFFEAVDIGNQRLLSQEFVQRLLIFHRVLQQAAQLLRIISPLDRLFGHLADVLKMQVVARLGGDFVEHRQQIAHLGHFLPASQHFGEGGELLLRRRAQRGRVVVIDMVERIGNAQTIAADPIQEGLQRLLADAARRHVDDALEADAVVGVMDQAQVGQQVLDLAPFVEAYPAHQRVGHSRVDEGLFHGAGLRVGAVHDGEVFIIQTAVTAQLPDALQHFAGFIALIKGFEYRRPLASTQLGMQGFGPTIAIAVDDGAGHIQDILRTAVILLEQDHRRLAIGLLETQYIAVVGAAKGVDGLIFVADHKDVVLRGGEEPHQLVLHLVGILKLIHQHIGEAILIVASQLGVVAHELHHVQQQVVEVHGIGVKQRLLISGVDLLDDFAEIVERPEFSRRYHLVLGA